VESIEVIVGTYEELTLGYRLVTDSEENKVACVLRVKYRLGVKGAAALNVTHSRVVWPSALLHLPSCSYECYEG